MPLWYDDAELFRHRRASPIRGYERWTLGVLLFLGLQSVVWFALWWFRADHVNQIVLFVLLSFATWFGVFRNMVGWYNVFHIDQPEPIPTRARPRVAIVTTSEPGETYEMFVRTLAAARDITYPHTTYPLDDTRDPRMRALAAEMGAVHLELLDVPGAKAGKINAALQLTDEELIVVLDPDH